MKKSTYMMLALVALGLLTASITPICLALLTHEDINPLDTTDRQTITMTAAPFNHLFVERSDSSNIYAEIKLSITSCDTITSPEITMLDGWGEWVALTESADTLTATISIPDAKTDKRHHTWQYVTLRGTLTLPSGRLPEIKATANSQLDITLDSITSPTFATEGIHTIKFNNCAIDTFDMHDNETTAGYDAYSQIIVDRSHINAMTLTAPNTSVSLYCYNNALIDTLYLCNSGKNSTISMTDAHIGAILPLSEEAFKSLSIESSSASTDSPQ